MRQVHVGRTIAAPAAVVWELLTDVESWPEWGPSIRDVTVDGDPDLGSGTRGTVTTSVGVALPFEITTFDPGRAWAWRVAGFDATSHRVEAIDAVTSRVEFGVWWPAWPYLAVCRIALARIERLALARLV